MAKVSDKGGKYHHGDLRRALVEAALQLVQEEGPSGITLREAARRAGVTHAAPYRHFADKEALLAAVAEEGFKQLRDQIAESMAAGGDAIDAVGRAYVKFAMNNPSQFKVMFGAQVGDKRNYSSLLEADQAVFDLLVSAIDSAQKSSDLPDGNTAAMGMVAWSMVHGVASLVVHGQMDRAGVSPDQIEELARRVTRTAHAGLKDWPHTAGKKE